MGRLKHLLVIEDGKLIENSLHPSERARGEHLSALILGGVLGDDIADQAPSIMQEADQEALQADYPSGYGASMPRPEDYVDPLRDWLATEGIDVFTEDLALPLQSTRAEAVVP